MRSSPLLWLALVATISLLALAPAANADKTVHAMPVTAHDDASPCVQGQAPCFAVDGDPTGLIEDDDQLDVTFENNGTRTHSLLLAPGAEAEPDNGTPSEAAFVELGPLDPGETAEATVEVPRGTDTLHIYCNVGDHEEQGMHLSRNVYPGGSVQEAENQTIGEPGQGQVPLGGGLGVVALVTAGLVIRRRR